MSTQLLHSNANVIDILAEYTPHLPEFSGISVTQRPFLHEGKNRVLLMFQSENSYDNWESIARWAEAFDVPVNISWSSISAEISLAENFLVGCTCSFNNHHLPTLIKVLGGNVVANCVLQGEVSPRLLLEKIQEFKQNTENVGNGS